ncbi:hypothetical protein [Methylobacter sp. S3L5C]|uniref:hypothetical protein n=1 Tax=Methylobacter sp. S3L5C TaxID=2839024 RepID=UPI001FACA14C|nr:hypothetical protein [Methylobacter sp. S3L5C]UOA08481.1 hypothetical protein KKZ03_20180 [Methylobacter sp. S3L5C]
MSHEFLKPRLVGERFNKHSVPLELLKDFAALEEMIVEVAKWKFKESHPKQKRIPSGFGKDLSLHISNIENGSAIPVIILMYAMSCPVDTQTQVEMYDSPDVYYFKQARDLVIETIACAVQSKPLPLPAQFLGYFDRFGRGLRGDEYIEFNDNELAKLTLETREKLIRASKVDEWTEDRVLKGRISEADQSRMRFELELKNGTKLRAPLTSQHLDTILDAFNNYANDARVVVQGAIKIDRQNQPKSIEFVEHITLIDPLDVDERLDELAKLEDGWLDGKGVALNPENLLWLGKSFESKFDADLPLPYLYPTSDGNIQAEWPIGNWEASIEINLDKKCAEWQALNLKSDKCIDSDFDLSNDDGWSKLNQALKELHPEENV